LKLNLQNATLKLKNLRDTTLSIDAKKALLDLEKQKQDFENKKTNFEYFKQEQASKLQSLEDTLQDKKNEYNILVKDQKNTLTQIKLSPQEKLLAFQDATTKLQTLQDEYTKDSQNFDINLTKKRNDYFTSISKEYVDTRNALITLNTNFSQLDEIFGFKENKNTQYNYSVFFSAKNTEYKNKASLDISSAYTYYQQVQKNFDAITDNTDIKALLGLIEIEKQMYTKLLSASNYLSKGLDNSIES
jgi:hypothetical protein